MSDTTEAGPSEEWVRPRPGRNGYRNDLLLALALAVGTTISFVLFRATGSSGEAPGWQIALWIVGVTLPLALRRRWPEAVAIVSSLAFAAAFVLEVGELLFSQICLFVAIYSVGAWGRSRRVATVVRAVIVSAMLAWVFWQLIYYSAVQDYLPELARTATGALSPYLAYGLISIISNLLYFGGAWFFGDSAYRSARAKALLEQRTVELAEERERTKQQAVALERVRIARELHDVVAHPVSVMGVQAGAARRVLERDPAQASAALSVIEQNARSAVDELHLLLGTLRSDQPEAGAEPAHQSSSTRGIEALPELVADAAASGLPAVLSVIGQARAMPGGVSLSVYRVAQEALTNSRKHGGGGARADLRVRYLADAVELEVSDTGVGASARGGAAGATNSSGGSGLGHIGMRERVAAVGGRIEIGPRARGGYRVRAWFPLAPAVGATVEPAAAPLIEPAEIPAPLLEPVEIPFPDQHIRRPLPLIESTENV